VKAGGETVTEIRPHGSVLGLLPFGLQVTLLVIYIFIASSYAFIGRWAPMITMVLGLGSLLIWQAMYHWRARIIVRSAARKLEIRGRFISRVISRAEIQSAVRYGLRGNEAVAYLDKNDRRLLTLRLTYWTLGDVGRLNDRLEIWLDQSVNSTVSSPPGKGLLPFMESHRYVVGASIPFLVVIALVIAFTVWSWWPN
jgi:hypothetical protein